MRYVPARIKAAAGINPRIDCSKSKVKSKVSPQRTTAAKPVVWPPCDAHWLAIVLFLGIRRLQMPFGKFRHGEMIFLSVWSVGEMVVKVRWNLLTPLVHGCS